MENVEINATQFEGQITIHGEDIAKKVKEKWEKQKEECKKEAKKQANKIQAPKTRLPRIRYPTNNTYGIADYEFLEYDFDVRLHEVNEKDSHKLSQNRLSPNHAWDKDLCTIIVKPNIPMRHLYKNLEIFFTDVLEVEPEDIEIYDVEREYLEEVKKGIQTLLDFSNSH